MDWELIAGLVALLTALVALLRELVRLKTATKVSGNETDDGD